MNNANVDYDGSEEAPTCPLCMEDLDETDKDFFPCPCDYQVCLWCLEYIKTNLVGKCPACRQQYNESKYRYVQSKPAELLRRNAKSGAKHAARETHKNPSAAPSEPLPATRRDNTTCNASTLANLKDVRVIQRNLCYVLGLPPSIARKEGLCRPEFFGRYGSISNIVVTRTQSNASAASYSAYVTFSSTQEAVDAIRDIDGALYEGRVLRSSFGTTKYCSFFLRGVQCVKPDCFYLHHLGDESDSFTREEMISSRTTMFTDLPTPNNANNLNNGSSNLSIYRLQLKCEELSSTPFESQFGKPISEGILQQTSWSDKKSDGDSEEGEEISKQRQAVITKREWGGSQTSRDGRRCSLESRKTGVATRISSRQKLSPTSQQPNDSSSSIINSSIQFPEIDSQVLSKKSDQPNRSSLLRGPRSTSSGNAWNKGKSAVLFQKVKSVNSEDESGSKSSQLPTSKASQLPTSKPSELPTSKPSELPTSQSIKSPKDASPHYTDGSFKNLSNSPTVDSPRIEFKTVDTKDAHKEIKKGVKKEDVKINVKRDVTKEDVKKEDVTNEDVKKDVKEDVKNFHTDMAGLSDRSSVIADLSTISNSVVFGEREQDAVPHQKVSQTRPEMSQTQSEMSQTQPEMSQTQSEMSQTRPEMSQTQSEISQTRPEIFPTRPETLLNSSEQNRSDIIQKEDREYRQPWPDLCSFRFDGSSTRSRTDVPDVASRSPPAIPPPRSATEGIGFDWERRSQPSSKAVEESIRPFHTLIPGREVEYAEWDRTAFKENPILERVPEYWPPSPSQYLAETSGILADVRGSSGSGFSNLSQHQQQHQQHQQHQQQQQQSRFGPIYYDDPAALDSGRAGGIGSGACHNPHSSSVLGGLSSEVNTQSDQNASSMREDARNLEQSRYRMAELDRYVSSRPTYSSQPNDMLQAGSTNPFFGQPPINHPVNPPLYSACETRREPINDSTFAQLQVQARIYEQQIQEHLKMKIEQHLLVGDVHTAAKLESERNAVATALLRAKLTALITSTERATERGRASQHIPLQRPAMLGAHPSSNARFLAGDTPLFADMYNGRIDESLLLGDEESRADLAMYQGSMLGRTLRNRYQGGAVDNLGIRSPYANKTYQTIPASSYSQINGNWSSQDNRGLLDSSKLRLDGGLFDSRPIDRPNPDAGLQLLRSILPNANITLAPTGLSPPSPTVNSVLSSYLFQAPPLHSTPPNLTPLPKSESPPIPTSPQQPERPLSSSPNYGGTQNWPGFYGNLSDPSTR